MKLSTTHVSTFFSLATTKNVVKDVIVSMSRALDADYYIFYIFISELKVRHLSLFVTTNFVCEFAMEFEKCLRCADGLYLIY